ncbi:TetR/AcrR family transcriptional regulator [Cupriavidus basilensis]|uniref:TetR/AcrR family transcriptional regulator n=2 Tax=Cupriavidus basilensis TaxID=68895 RepID=A0A643G3P3_9BURK|nr:TetR/AcrR family transcriptional regulator [Cupriavidus basilensis]
MAKQMNSVSKKTKPVETEIETAPKRRGAAEKPAKAKAALKAVAGAPAEKKKSAPAKKAAVAVAPTAPAAATPRRRRSNKRSQQTIDNIFEATEKVILESGAERISILEVCNTASISRGTFYRYFASQEELLDAFSRYKRETFHKSLAELLEPINDPDERFATLVKYLEDYMAIGSSRRLLLVAPEFAMSFFKRIFHDSVVRFQDFLAPVFDAWDERLGIALDRELICDLLIRMVMSENLVWGESDHGAMSRRIGRMVEALRFGGVTRARR